MCTPLVKISPVVGLSTLHTFLAPPYSDAHATLLLLP
jgi:hypothetical protein